MTKDKTSSKRLNEWKDMQLSGALAWIHHIVMLTTFPIRKFWQNIVVIIALMVVLISVPMFYGVEFSNISNWYIAKLHSSQLSKLKTKAKLSINEHISMAETALKERFVDIENMTADNKKNQTKNEGNKFVSWNVAEFKKAKYETQNNHSANQHNVVQNSGFTELKQQAKQAQQTPDNQKHNTEFTTKNELLTNITNNEPTLIHPQITLPEKIQYDGKLSDYYTVLEGNDFAYVSEPEKLYGTITVVGPNSLYLNDNFLLLYGVYTNPKNYDAQAAQQYLTDITEDRNILCEVVAYTVQTQTASALCFVNGISINRALVNHNLADNTALK